VPHSIALLAIEWVHDAVPPSRRDLNFSFPLSQQSGVFRESRVPHSIALFAIEWDHDAAPSSTDAARSSRS
jgi:hypothetical protein